MSDEINISCKSCKLMTEFLLFFLYSCHVIKIFYIYIQNWGWNNASTTLNFSLWCLVKLNQTDENYLPETELKQRDLPFLRFWPMKSISKATIYSYEIKIYKYTAAAISCWNRISRIYKWIRMVSFLWMYLWDLKS